MPATPDPAEVLARALGTSHRADDADDADDKTDETDESHRTGKTGDPPDVTQPEPPALDRRPGRG